MTPSGHASTQLPQLMHESLSTVNHLPLNVIASVTQLETQERHDVQTLIDFFSPLRILICDSRELKTPWCTAEQTSSHILHPVHFDASVISFIVRNCHPLDSDTGYDIVRFDFFQLREFISTIGNSYPAAGGKGQPPEG
jgi:hypothetical protein